MESFFRCCCCWTWFSFDFLILHFLGPWCEWKSLSHVQLFTTHGLHSLWNSPGQNTGVGPEKGKTTYSTTNLVVLLKLESPFSIWVYYLLIFNFFLFILLVECYLPWSIYLLNCFFSPYSSCLPLLQQNYIYLYIFPKFANFFCYSQFYNKLLLFIFYSLDNLSNSFEDTHLKL